MNSYNGESALENPLFICTNRILTLAWGILYVITSIWTFFLMGTPISSYLAVINNISIKNFPACAQRRGNFFHSG